MATLVSVTDTGRFRRALVSFLGRQQVVQLLAPYGFVHSPPRGSQVVLLPIMDDESNQVGIADAQPSRTLRDLKPGEVAVCTDEGDYLYFKSNRAVELNTEKTYAISPGGVEVTGSVAASDNLSSGTGASGSFTTPTGQTVTVQDGIIVNIF
ncbi:phage baseplate assembly protein [Lysobacter sp. GCM10012299]|uniref:phage baseplate assembly protein domain-containing protein n=1 Tax=Lysobacter sp. GCM10012299 TaxID=3317333 RepID=UPI0036166F4C